MTFENERRSSSKTMKVRSSLAAVALVPANNWGTVVGRLTNTFCSIPRTDCFVVSKGAPAAVNAAIAASYVMEIIGTFLLHGCLGGRSHRSQEGGNRVVLRTSTSTAPNQQSTTSVLAVRSFRRIV
jgi:hypothetical protein